MPEDPRPQHWFRRLFRRPPTTHQAVSSFDIITFIASMAKDPHAIEHQLDKVRVITSKIDPNAPLRADDLGILRGVYLSIERQLIEQNDDPPLTAEDIRHRVRAHFDPIGLKGNNNFWSSIHP